jgi:prolipoprotein diacylglyceryltransferase
LLENRLKQNDKTKLNLLWAIFVSIVGPFIIPYLPTKRSSYGNNFAESIGYWNAGLMFSGFLLLIMPYLIYKEYDKMKRNKFDIIGDLETLEKEFKKSSNN